MTASAASKNFTAIAVTLLILLGAAARFADLDTHFTHIDDLGVARTFIFNSTVAKGRGMQLKNLFDKITIIPHEFTYAPLQFFITYFLVSPEQSYRQILFWGRFPSCLFGILGLLSLVIFFRKYDRFKTPAVFIALALLAFSHENIIYAKQMESYSIGVFAAVWVLILLISGMRRGNFSLKKLLTAFAGMALLSYMQYQVIFLTPAFALALLAYHLLTDRIHWREIILNLLIGGALYGLLIFPEYHSFIHFHASFKPPGLNWNAGPSQEFSLQFLPGTPLFTRIAGFVLLFARNLPVVFGSMISFVPEDSLLFHPVTVFFLALFILGIAGLFKTRRLSKKMLGLFFLAVAAIWMALVVTKKLAFSPTRHSLILLPFFAVVAAEGWNSLLGILKPFSRVRSWARFAHIPLIGFILIMFGVSFPRFLSERKDPFDEKEIEQKLSEFNVDTVIATGWTWNLSLMKNVWEKYSYFEEEFRIAPSYRTHPVPFKTIAFISHRNTLNPGIFEAMKYRINLHSLTAGEGGGLWTSTPEDYRMVYSKEIVSDVEIDFSKRTQNGTNSFFFYILRKV